MSGSDLGWEEELLAGQELTVVHCNRWRAFFLLPWMVTSLHVSSTRGDGKVLDGRNLVFALRWLHPVSSPVVCLP